MEGLSKASRGVTSFIAALQSLSQGPQASIRRLQSMVARLQTSIAAVSR